MTTSQRELHESIARCESCPANVVRREWPPISFFGDVAAATGWTISINPSAREFTDHLGRELTGKAQRFALVRDFTGARTRAELTAQHLARVLSMQETVLRRVPYRNYFNRLGRFIQKVYSLATDEPLAPYTSGLVAGGTNELYCHMDIVKCATTRPWSDLADDDQRALIRSCSPYLEEQMVAAEKLGTILINGRTALEVCIPVMRGSGLGSATRLVELATTSTDLLYGDMLIGTRTVRVVAWSSNVVNQFLRSEDTDRLAAAVRSALRSSATS